MSPVLFDLYLDAVLRDDSRAGHGYLSAPPAKESLDVLAFADDMALIGACSGGLQASIDACIASCAVLVLNVKTQKTVTLELDYTRMKAARAAGCAFLAGGKELGAVIGNSLP